MLSFSIIDLVLGLIGGGISGVISAFIMIKRYHSRSRIEYIGMGKSKVTGYHVTVGEVGEKEKKKANSQRKFLNEYENITAYNSVSRKKGKGILKETIATRFFNPPVSDSETRLARKKDTISISGPEDFVEILMFATGEKNGEEHLLVPVAERPLSDESIQVEPSLNSLPTLFDKPVIRVGKFENWKDNELSLVVSSEGAEGVNLTKTFEELKNNAEWLVSTQTQAIKEGK